MTTQEFIDAIKGMTVLELNDLVKACEEEFGVSAAAGVVVAAAGGAADAAAEKDEFDVELTEVGPNKVKVIKVVREVTGLGRKLRKLLTALLRLLRKLLLRRRQKRLRLNWKAKALRLPLNKSCQYITVFRKYLSLVKIKRMLLLQYPFIFYTIGNCAVM